MSKPGHRFTSDQLRLSATTRRLSNGIQRLSNGIQRPDRISAYQHQTSSCISTTRPTPATLVERPAANIYNATIPANDVTHPSWRLHTTATDIYIHVCNSGNKIVSFVVSIILPSVSLHCLWLSHYSHAYDTYDAYDALIRLRNMSSDHRMVTAKIRLSLHNHNRILWLVPA